MELYILFYIEFIPDVDKVPHESRRCMTSCENNELNQLV